MSAEPGDARAAAAGGHGHFRASHADREQVIAMLKVAFVQGRLSKDELDARMGQTFAARTYGELAELTADLPAGQTVAPPLRPPVQVRARRPVNKTVIWGASGTITPVMLVLGADSQFTAEEDVAEFRRRLPAARVEVVPGAGHAVQSDRPLPLARLIEDFIA